MSAEDELLLVTGGTGFVASWVVHLALQRGWRVRATVRNPSKAQHLKQLPGAKERLELVSLNLLGAAQDFERAVEGCTLVAHVASPFFYNVKNPETEMIKPAVEGTLGVLRAVASPAGAKVKAVVLTSSLVAVTYGYTPAEVEKHGPFTEADWTRVDGHDVTPYERSKVLAEKAAWEFYKAIQPAPAWSLCTMNPGAVFGPAFVPDVCTSVDVVKKFVSGELPLIPDLGVPAVDVRDVAEAHLRALVAPRDAVNGHRFLLSYGTSMEGIVQALQKHLGPMGYRFPKHKMPYFMAWLFSFIVTELQGVLGIWGRPAKPVDCSPAHTVLQLGEFRPLDQTLADTADSLIMLGVCKKTAKFTSSWTPPTEGAGAGAAQ